MQSLKERKRETIGFLLRFHQKKARWFRWVELGGKAERTDVITSGISAWDRVLLARKFDRPTSLDYIDNLFDDFYELSGGRVSGDDHAIVGGLATFNGRPITVIGNQRVKAP